MVGLTKLPAVDWVDGSDLQATLKMMTVYMVAGVEAGIGVVDAAIRYYNADTNRQNEIWEASVAGESLKI